MIHNIQNNKSLPVNIQTLAKKEEKEQKEDCVTQTVANTYALKYYTHINLQVFGNG